MIDQCKIPLASAEKTRFAGASLAATLYRFPLTVALSGELGAGKTTFLRGFAASLGIREPVTSPTYALEQRYALPPEVPAGTFIHIDLYRLREDQAAALLAATDDHTGIRAVEWSERAGTITADAMIDVRLAEIPEGRSLIADFRDMPLPSYEDIRRWRDEVRLPQHIRDHCDAVAALAEKLGQQLMERGAILRPLALRRSAEAHDLLRFLDFRKDAGPESFRHSAEDERIWREWGKKFPGMKHEPACTAFLQEQGYPEVASIVAPHGLHTPSLPCTTIEQKILFYADKRVKVDEVVTLEQRFDDFRLRYRHGEESPEGQIWFAEAKKLELELFPDGL